MESDRTCHRIPRVCDRQRTAITKFKGDLPPVGLSQFTISPDEKTLFVVRADPVSANIESAYLSAIRETFERSARLQCECIE